VSAWLERLHTLVPATHAGSDSSDRSDSTPNGPNGPIGAGIAVRSEISKPPPAASADRSDESVSTPEPEPVAGSVPVDGEGLPCGPCGVCGGLSFWRPIASDGWRCIVCAERRGDHPPHGKMGSWCSLPTPYRLRVLSHMRGGR
jgi:hypothetical protein